MSPVGAVTITSQNAVRWEVVNTNVPLNSIAFGNGSFVALGPEGPYTTMDGTTWERTATTNSLQRVFFAAGKFFATVETGALFVSKNGTAWEEIQPFTHFILNDIAATEFSIVASAGGL